MKTLAYFSAAISIVPALAGLIKYQSAGKLTRLIIFYFFLCATVEAFSLYMNYNSINNNLLADIFYMLEGLLLISYFYLIFNERDFFYPSIILAIAYLGYGLFTTIIDPGPMAYNSNFRTGESLIVQAMSAYALIRYSKMENLNLVKDTGFWIAAGLFIYFSVNVAIFFTATFLIDESTYVMRKTWIIHSVVNTLVNLIFTFGLTCIPSKQPR